MVEFNIYLMFKLYKLFFNLISILCRSICLSLSISNSFPVYVHAVFHFVPPLEIHNLCGETFFIFEIGSVVKNQHDGVCPGSCTENTQGQGVQGQMGVS
jgi:branched-subunit amino acid transport protein